MPVYLIILIVIAALALGLFLLYKYLEWDRYSRGRPYKLDSLEPEEYVLLLQAYSKAIEPETGTFRGGGVWRKEASLSQLEFKGALIRGQLSKEELEELKGFVIRLMNSNPDNAILESIYRKLCNL
jgi:hypothetical protein